MCLLKLIMIWLFVFCFLWWRPNNYYLFAFKNAFQSCLFLHCVKSVRIWSYSGQHFSRIFPYADWIRRDTGRNAEKCGRNADQNNSEYGHFLRIESFVGELIFRDQSYIIRFGGSKEWEKLGWLSCSLARSSWHTLF